MRLWSIHPKYLDSKGLVAVWREGLLAKNVLGGKTKGYTKHPQLIRFRKHSSTLDAINYYLFYILGEATNRGYKFDKDKIGSVDVNINKIKVNSGQIDYEFSHLKKKLKMRSSDLYTKIVIVKHIEPHPLFEIKHGKIEDWEIT